MDEEILDYNEQKEGWVSKVVDWQKKHISDRQMTLILAFIIGLLASVAGYFLHGIVHEIQLLLTSGFNKGTYNLLFLLFPIVAFTSPCSLLNMWSEIIFPTVSPVCFTPSLPKFQAQGPQLLVIGGGIRYHHRFRWFRGSRGSYCAHGFGHRLKPGTNFPHGQENHDSAGGLWRLCSHCWNL